MTEKEILNLEVRGHKVSAIIDALCTILDGETAHDIHNMTGLDREHVEEIVDMKSALSPVWMEI